VPPLPTPAPPPYGLAPYPSPPGWDARVSGVACCLSRADDGAVLGANLGCVTVPAEADCVVGADAEGVSAAHMADVDNATADALAHTCGEAALQCRRCASDCDCIVTGPAAEDEYAADASSWLPRGTPECVAAYTCDLVAHYCSAQRLDSLCGPCTAASGVRRHADPNAVFARAHTTPRPLRAYRALLCAYHAGCAPHADGAAACAAVDPRCAALGCCL
jgi:hypothetical protein